LILGGATLHRCDNCFFSGTALQAAEKLRFYDFVLKGRGFIACGKTPVLYLVIALAVQSHDINSLKSDAF
jgi:hypothetical protein